MGKWFNVYLVTQSLDSLLTPYYLKYLFINFSIASLGIFNAIKEMSNPFDVLFTHSQYSAENYRPLHEEFIVT